LKVDPRWADWGIPSFSSRADEVGGSVGILGEQLAHVAIRESVCGSLTYGPSLRPPRQIMALTAYIGTIPALLDL
jgi:hypothetical protein